ncbi:MAG: hypothetical protein ABI687_11160 [Flavitalea sp.]
MTFNKKGLFFSCISIIFFSVAGMAQSQDRQSFKRNSLYAEGANRSAPYTLNFDHVFHMGDKLAYSYRVGFSLISQDITVPVGINLITGVGNHHFEASTTLIPYLKLNDNKSDPTNLYLYLIPAVGYRFQKQQGGLFFKASVGPAFKGNPGIDDFWNMHIKTYGYGSLALGITL